jgi:glycosyltransferase involved in cell wall biosynthesis
MRVLQINNCHYKRGGADVVYLNTIQLLKKNGHEVVEFSQLNKSNEYSDFEKYFIKDSDIFNHGFFKKILLTPQTLFKNESFVKLNQLIKDTQPDLAHIHLYKGGLTISIFDALRTNNIPVCITLHDFGLLCPRNIFFDGDNNICEMCLQTGPISCVLKRCNRKNIFYSTVNYLEFMLNRRIKDVEKCLNVIISVSKFNYYKHTEVSKFPEKYTHLYNFSPECIKAVPSEEKGDYFLYFGRLSEEKGLFTLLESFKRSSVKSHLKIVGTGQVEENLKQLIKTDSRIEFLGYKSGNELQNLITNCSFIIVPSEWYENNPMTIVEAYSLGKPAIGSNIGGIPELIENGKTGFLFEMKNVSQLMSVVESAELLSEDAYKSMSKQARAFAIENFTEEKHYLKLETIYKKIILEHEN